MPHICSATSLREDEGGSALLGEHRAGVVPLLIRLLFPKMRKRSGRLGGKGARGRRRWGLRLLRLLRRLLQPLHIEDAAACLCRTLRHASHL